MDDEIKDVWPALEKAIEAGPKILKAGHKVGRTLSTGRFIAVYAAVVSVAAGGLFLGYTYINAAATKQAEAVTKQVASYPTETNRKIEELVIGQKAASNQRAKDIAERDALIADLQQKAAAKIEAQAQELALAKAKIVSLEKGALRFKEDFVRSLLANGAMPPTAYAPVSKKPKALQELEKQLNLGSGEAAKKQGCLLTLKDYQFPCD